MKHEQTHINQLGEFKDTICKGVQDGKVIGLMNMDRRRAIYEFEAYKEEIQFLKELNKDLFGECRRVAELHIRSLVSAFGIHHWSDLTRPQQQLADEVIVVPKTFGQATCQQPPISSPNGVEIAVAVGGVVLVGALAAYAIFAPADPVTKMMAGDTAIKIAAATLITVGLIEDR
ncbi:MAG: hypothetical protein ACRCZF_20890 [Gemmataceae bacterium]